MNATRTNRLLWAAFAVSTFFGGLNALGVRYTVVELPPMWGATLRLVPSTLILFGLVFFLKLPLPKGKALLGSILFGLLNFGATMPLLYYSIKIIPPGMVQVILALVPLFTLLFAIAHRQEKFRWNALAGALLAIGGIALVFGEQIRDHIPLFTLLAVVLAAVSFAEATVIARNFPKSHPITTSAIAMATGAVVVFAISLLKGEPRELPAMMNTWIALIYLIVFGSVIMFLLVLYILKQWTASAISYQFVLLPFVSLTVSGLLGIEKLTPILLGGGSLVLLGVFVGVLFTPRKRTTEAKPTVRIDASPCLECE